MLAPSAETDPVNTSSPPANTSCTTKSFTLIPSSAPMTTTTTIGPQNSNTTNTSPPTGDLHAATASKAWYGPLITTTILHTALSPSVLRFWEASTGKRGQEFADHANALRTHLWHRQHQHYPCIGLHLFLEITSPRHPLFNHLLARLMTPGSESVLLDLGCGLGQEARYWVWSGVERRRVVGVDREGGMVKGGRVLFEEGEGVRMLVGDFFAEAGHGDNGGEGGGNVLSQVGEVDIILCGLLFHLFPLPTQIALGLALIRKLHGRPNPVILGWQTGMAMSGEHGLAGGAKVFGHSVESVRGMWEEVGRVSGVVVRVEARMEEAPVFGRGFVEREFGGVWRVGLVFWWVWVGV